MDDKLRRLMKHEGINSTRLAEILGIQASGISHIMSGRNKPSYDFLLKLLQRFPQISPDWLLLDKGPMYRDEIKKGGGSGGGLAGTGASVGTGGANLAGAVGFADDRNRLQNAVSATRGGLFAPDNSDIIPFGAQVSELAGRQPAQQTAPPASQPAVRQALQSEPWSATLQAASQATWQAAPQASQQASPQTSQSTAQQQPSVYQASNLVRSASVERIVVFYKDKTFSEYRPE